MHAEPFALDLTGPAGDRYRRGETGDIVHIDAVESCRVLSGRADARGVLTHRLPL